MKKLLLLPSLFIVLTASAQTSNYLRTETTKFKADKLSSKTTKYESGTLDISSKSIIIDKEADKPIAYTVATTGDFEPYEQGYYTKTYICVNDTKSGLKAFKIVAVYTPKKELCDLIVKKGHTTIDYCITEK